MRRLQKSGDVKAEGRGARNACELSVSASVPGTRETPCELQHLESIPFLQELIVDHERIVLLVGRRSTRDDELESFRVEVGEKGVVKDLEEIPSMVLERESEGIEEKEILRLLWCPLEFKGFGEGGEGGEVDVEVSSLREGEVRIDSISSGVLDISMRV